MKRLYGIIVGFSAITMMSGSAAAERATFSSFLEPSHVVARHLHQEWADAVEKASDGQLGFEIFTGGALLPAQGSMTGVAEGVAQASLLPAAYAPSALPVANAIGDFGFKNPDHYVMAFAYTDFMMNEEVGYDDWRKNGVIFGAGFSTPEYYYICNKDLSTLEDMRGQRVRLPGLGWARFGQYIGLTPVALPVSEIYMALDRGALDCVSIDASALISGPSVLSLTESVVMLPTMPGYASAGIFYNPVYWQGLSDDDRRLLLNETARAMARTQIAYDALALEGLKQAEEAGVKLNEPDEALENALHDWVNDGVGGMAKIAKERHGINDPDALFALFQGYVDKWDRLMEGVDRTDEEIVTEILRTNLFDKINVSSYGME